MIVMNANVSTSAIASALDNAIDVKIAKAQRAPRKPKGDDTLASLEATSADANKARIAELEAALANATVAPVTSNIANNSHLIETVFTASRDIANGEQVLVKAMRAAGSEQKPVRDAAIMGRMCAMTGWTREHVIILLGRTGNPKKTPVHADDVRSPDQERAYGAARVWLVGFMKRHELVTTSEQGGARDKGVDQTMSTEKLVQPGKPKVETADDLGAYCMARAKADYDFFLLNKAHKVVMTDMGADLMGAFADHLELIRSIVKAHEGAKA
jgi:hypothetical protein